MKKFLIVILCLFSTWNFVLTPKTEANVDVDHRTNAIEVTKEYLSSSLNAVIDNGELYVAVGEDGTILTSSDGDEWTRRESNTSHHLFSIAWSGHKFVAVGEGLTILTSDDGLNWTLVQSSLEDRDIQSFVKVLWNGRMFLAANNYYLYRSYDGLIWNKVFDSYHFTDLFIGNDQFIGIEDSIILRSIDGFNFSTFASPPNVEFTVGAWNGKEFLLSGEQSLYKLINGNNIRKINSNKVGFHKLIWDGTKYYGIHGNDISISNDGNVWIDLTIEQSASLNDIEIGKRDIVAVGEEETILLSSNGSDWEVKHHKKVYPDFEEVTFINGKFFVMNKHLNMYLVSNNGYDWEEINTDYDLTPTTEIIYANHLWISLNNMGRVIASKDLIEWYVIDSGNEDIRHKGLIWNGQIFLAWGDKYIHTSKDLKDWTITLQSKNDIYDLMWDGKAFLGFYSNDGYDKILIESADGKDWNNIEDDIFYISAPTQLIKGAKEYYFADYGHVYHSKDKITWKQIGPQWTKNHNIYYLNNEYFVIGDYSISASSNGVNWDTSYSGNSRRKHDAAYGNGVMVVVGSHGVILTYSRKLVDLPSRSCGLLDQGQKETQNKNSYKPFTSSKITNAQVGNTYQVGNDIYHTGTIVGLYKTNAVTNSTSNISNDPIVFNILIDNEWYYDNNYRLKLDGSRIEKNKLNLTPYAIIDDYIYGVMNDPLTNDLNIYKVKKDGSNLTKVIDLPIRYFYLLKDRIIFIPDYETVEYHNVIQSDSIYSVGFDGSNLAQLACAVDGWFTISDGWIYYSAEITNSAEFIGYNTNLMKMRFDGSDKKSLQKNVNSTNLIVNNGWVYYINGTDGHKVYKVRIDGSQSTAVTTDSSVAGFGVSNNYVYYNFFDPAQLKTYRVDKNGKKKIRIEGYLSKRKTKIVDVSSNYQMQTNIVVNNNYINTNKNIIFMNGNIMVPIREIFTALGGQIQLDPDSTKIQFTNEKGITGSVTINQKNVKFGEKTLQLNQPVTKHNGTTYIPAELVREVYGAEIEWDDFSNTLIVIKF
jgi:photosystem II stability/assembly factor-like uncharacterized protein